MKLRLFVVLALGFFLSGQGVLAVGARGQVGQAVRELKQGEKMAAKKDLKCAEIINRINERHGVLRGYKIKRIEAYTNIITRLEKIASKQKEKGKNVADLEKNIATLKVMHEELRVEYEGLVKNLETARSLDCGDANGEFKKALQEAKTARESIRGKISKIQNFIKTDIKNSLLELK